MFLCCLVAIETGPPELMGLLCEVQYTFAKCSVSLVTSLLSVPPPTPPRERRIPGKELAEMDAGCGFREVVPLFCTPQAQG